MTRVVNNKLLSLASILLFFLTVNVSYAFDVSAKGCETDCKECHKIDQGEASNVLKDLVDKVISVEDGPVKGMWEVEIEAKGRRFPVYLHYSKKYFLAGNVIDIKNRRMIGKPARAAQRPKVDVAKIPLKDALVMGNPSAKNKVIVFDDPDCQYCRKLHKELKEIISKRKDIAFYIKLYPLVNLHPQAYNKSMSIVCEKSVKLLDEALSGKKIPPPKCKTTQIDENIRLAESLGITGTPTIILENGTIIPGYMNADNLMRLIDSIIK